MDAERHSPGLQEKFQEIDSAVDVGKALQIFQAFYAVDFVTHHLSLGTSTSSL